MVKEAEVVFGGSGLIGRALIEAIPEDRDVVCVSLTRPQITRSFEHTRIDLSRPWISDLLPSRVRSVFYLAQSPKFRDFPQASEEVFQVNTVSVLSALNYARLAGAKSFVFASTGGVYEGGDLPLSETTAIQPRDSMGFYAKTKHCSEILCRSFHEYFSIAILRYFFVYGRGQGETMLVPRLVSRVRGGQEIEIEGDEGMVSQPCFVSDAAEATLRAADLQGWNVANVAGPEPMSLRAVIQEIGRQLGVAPRIVSRPVRPVSYIPDTSFMATKLMRPKVVFRDGLARVLSPLL